MRPIIFATLMFLVTLDGWTQKAHIKQSTPFENLMLSLSTDSVDLFMNSFSTNIIDGNYDAKEWQRRLSSAQRKLEARFQFWSLEDFAFEFDKVESRLIIYFKGEENIRMKVVKEKRQWKLDEK